MIPKLTLLLLAAALIVAPRISVKAAEAPSSSTTKIVQAYRAYLEQSAKIPPDEALAKHAASLREDGAWADIDYADRSRSGWDPNQHLGRCRGFWMAFALKGRKDLEAPARRSLAWWLANKPEESQWWHREIGVPMQMRDLIIVAGDLLTAEEREGAMRQLAQHKVQGTGANLVWSADLGLHYAALRGDEPRVAELAQVLADVIQIAGPDEEGVQPDFSYHQHGPCLQTFHYGGSYLSDSTRLAWELRDTPWAFPPEKADILINYALEGMRWQMRGNQTVPSTLDRAATRANALRRSGTSTFEMLADFAPPEKAAQLRDYAASIKENRPAVTGFRWYPHSDFGVWHSPEGSYFVKTISTRTRLTESINEENLLGAQFHSGDTYLIRQGDEYFNLLPAWDWDHLPGVTWAEHARKPMRQAYSGGLGNGVSGLIAWHQEVSGPSPEDHLRLRKMTAIHEGTLLTLWSGLEVTPGMGRVNTTIDQFRAFPGTGRPTSNHLASGGGELKGGVSSQSGDWFRINRAHSKDKITETVSKEWLEHAPGARAGYYAIDIQGPASSPLPAEILVNDASAQVVRWKNGLIMVAFHEPGEAAGLSVNRACLVISDGTSLWAADPLHQGGELRATLHGNTAHLELPLDGSSTQATWK